MDNSKKAINAYKSVNATEIEKLIKDNMNLVKKAVYSIAKNIPKYIDEEDLLQVGYIGLVKAAQNYTGENGAKFSTYAYYRVRGSIYDEIRSSDWKPRRAQKRTKMITAAILKLTQKNDGAPDADNIAKELDISVEEYYVWLKETSSVRIVPMEGNGDDPLEVGDDTQDTYTKPEKLEIHSILKQSISKLPNRSAQIVSLYYVEDLTFKEIGYIMEMSATGCARIFKQALLILRANMEKSGVTHG